MDKDNQHHINSLIENWQAVLERPFDFFKLLEIENFLLLEGQSLFPLEW